jgi:hypothetical protein
MVTRGGKCKKIKGETLAVIEPEGEVIVTAVADECSNAAEAEVVQKIDQRFCERSVPFQVSREAHMSDCADAVSFV